MLERINLVPQKPISERLKFISPLVLCLLMTCVLGSIFVQYRIIKAKIVATEQANSTIHGKQLQADIILANKQKLATEISRLTEQRNKIKLEVADIESIRSNKRFYSKALNIISTILPPSVKCNAITFKENKGSIEGVAVNYHDLPILVNKMKSTDFIQYAMLNEADKVVGNQTALTFKITFDID